METTISYYTILYISYYIMGWDLRLRVQCLDFVGLSAQERAGTLWQELRTFVLAIVGLSKINLLQHVQYVLSACTGCPLNRPQPSVALWENGLRRRGRCMGLADGLDASTTSWALGLHSRLSGVLSCRRLALNFVELVASILLLFSGLHAGASQNQGALGTLVVYGKSKRTVKIHMRDHICAIFETTQDLLGLRKHVSTVLMPLMDETQHHPMSYSS